MPATCCSMPCSNRAPVPWTIKRLEPIRISCRQFQREYAAEGHAEHGRTFQPHKVQKLVQVAHEIGQAKLTPQRETIIFAAQLVADDLKVLRQDARQRGQATRSRPPSLEPAQEAALPPKLDIAPCNLAGGQIPCNRFPR